MNQKQLSRHVGNRLRAERTRLGLSQEAVARLCGLDRSAWAQYENGYCTPRCYALYRIIRRLGLDPTTLFPVDSTPSTRKA